MFGIYPVNGMKKILYCILYCINDHLTCLGVLVQWLKLPAWNVGDRGLEPRSSILVSKKQNVSSPLTRKDSILERAFVTVR